MGKSKPKAPVAGGKKAAKEAATKLKAAKADSAKGTKSTARQKKQADQARVEPEDEEGGSEEHQDDEEESQASPKHNPTDEEQEESDEEIADYNVQFQTKSILTLVFKCQFCWLGADGVRFIIPFKKSCSSGYFDFCLFFVEYGLCVLKDVRFDKKAAIQWLDHSTGCKPRENRDKLNKCIHDGICFVSSLTSNFFTEQDHLRDDKDHIIHFATNHTTDQAFLHNVPKLAFQRKTVAEPSRLFYDTPGGELADIELVQKRATTAHSQFARIHETIHHLLGKRFLQDWPNRRLARHPHHDHVQLLRPQKRY
jgi:hypothetical protein